MERLGGLVATLEYWYFFDFSKKFFYNIYVPGERADTTKKYFLKWQRSLNMYYYGEIYINKEDLQHFMNDAFIHNWQLSDAPKKHRENSEVT